jgi:hypothetical protein
LKYFSKNLSTHYIDKKHIIPFVDTSNKAKINLILSPEFYWMRIFEIPVKYEYEANKLLPTLFEDTIQNSSKIIYEYKAVKLDDEKFVCFAYIKDDINQTIKSSGISQNQIQNIYFAQTEIKENTKVDDEYSLVIIDDENPVLSKIPNNFAQNSEIHIEEYLNDITLSKHTISLDYFSSVLEPKNAIIVAILLILLSITNFVKLYQNNTQITKLKDEKANLIKTYKLPATSFQTKAILNKYKRISSYQSDLRVSIKKQFKANRPNHTFTLKAEK